MFSSHVPPANQMSAKFSSVYKSTSKLTRGKTKEWKVEYNQSPCGWIRALAKHRNKPLWSLHWTSFDFLKAKFVYIAELRKKLEIDIRYMSVRQKSRAMKFESPPVLRLRQNELNAVNNTWLTRFWIFVLLKVPSKGAISVHNPERVERCVHGLSRGKKILHHRDTKIS